MYGSGKGMLDLLLRGHYPGLGMNNDGNLVSTDNCFFLPLQNKQGGWKAV